MRTSRGWTEVAIPAFLGLFVALSVVALACLPARTAADGAALAVCALNHYGEPVATVAHECGDVEIALIEDIFAAHRDAMRRELAKEKVR
jgi:hypothetical protein